VEHRIFSRQRFGIEHVVVGRRDVEIAHHHQLRVPRQLAFQHPARSLQPAQLVGELLGAHGLAVDHVEIDDAHTVHGGRDHPLLRIVEARDPGLHVLQRVPARQDRDAVVGLLPGKDAAVAVACEHVVGEAQVLELGFLQRDHVRRGLAQPLLQVRQAHVERVDVPAGDLHGAASSITRV